MISSNFRSAILFVSIVFSIACGSGGSQKIVEDSSPIDSSTLKAPLPVDKDGSTQGLLKTVEDAGYPMATLTIQLPNQKEAEYFDINLEEVEHVTMPILNSFIGKNVNLSFKTETVNTLLDIYADGKSIFGEEFAPEGDYIKTIEGKLDGAKEVTPGDLPGKVSITDEKSQKLDFEFFITPEMVAVDQKRVKGYYDFLTRNTITTISKSE